MEVTIVTFAEYCAWITYVWSWIFIWFCSALAFWMFCFETSVCWMAFSNLSGRSTLLS